MYGAFPSADYIQNTLSQRKENVRIKLDEER